MEKAAKYSVVAETGDCTVLSEYIAERDTQTAYQSEADLEEALIRILQTQGYDYLPIKCEDALINNLRERLEALNGIKFSDAEWSLFFRRELSNPSLGIVEKTRTIQEDFIKILERDDGSRKNIYLLDKENIHRNALQVINQYVPAGGARPNRYDVTILVNGLPLVHIELKRRGIDIREAFNQICRYERESFWSGAGLFDYVQIFVISNGTLTKYYSNTTREQHFRENAAGTAKRAGTTRARTCSSFEFTSWWADARNSKIEDLSNFAKTFLAKPTLLNVLTKYCVFTEDESLLVMRPYQIAAAEQILGRIRSSTNYKTAGTRDGGGYVWHATGSGKTLTSFKAARLASRLPEIDKVLFVVDRKDLDYQTMREYDRFEKGAANSNSNTGILRNQLEDPNVRIIITTIQKLSIFIKKNPRHEVFQKRTVLIFDECHRSQFGEMHRAVIKHFRKYNLFGFTGTPIFAENAPTGRIVTAETGNGEVAVLQTTEQTFGNALHKYTVVDAINDRNVLPFRVDYVRTMRERDDVDETAEVYDIARERALNAPERIRNITEYILEHFDQKTKRDAGAYEMRITVNAEELVLARSRGKDAEERKELRRISGFNSILATASVESAKLYYTEFKKQLAERSRNKRLRVATIFSFAPNEPDECGLLDDENPEDTSALDASSRDFLENAIRDYNAMFGTNYDTSAEKFQNYYKDVSLRVKNREIDLLIVVNMFLTGFDATMLNTLWVDKNLRMHGLVQAYSRTNRILNAVKTYGNIVCFRNLDPATNKAFAIFGDKDAGGIVILRKFDDYYSGYTDRSGNDVPGYEDLIEQLQTKFPLGKPILGEKKEKEFIRLYGTILKMRNLLSAFDDFAGKEILSARDFQDYQSRYIDLYEKYRGNTRADETDIRDDIVFEMELVKNVEINIDTILILIDRYRRSGKKDKEIKITISKAVDASVSLRNKKDLIEAFIERITPKSDVDDEWREFVEERRKRELAELIKEENLKPEEAQKFVDAAFSDGFVRRTGTELTNILPPVSRFAAGGEIARKQRSRVLEKIEAFFARFFDISPQVNT